MTTSRQDKEFVESVISRTLLEDAIDWIKSNMSPGDVFSDSDLADWADSNGYIKDNGDD
jgi:hypothetical protein